METAEARYRQWLVERIDAAHEAARALPSDGPVRTALSDAHIEEHRHRVETESDVENALWPPLLMYAMQPWHTLDHLRLLDEDVTRIRDHPTGDPLNSTAWLASSPTEDREWRAGYFETCMKAKVLAFALTHPEAEVAFDVPLPSGRNTDIRLTLGERSYYLECTIITESDEDQGVHTAWLEARKTQPDLLLSRPGEFDPPGSKGPSSYYEANRFYIKVFDKLQKRGDPARTQTSDDMPNLLLLSCWPNLGSPLPFSPAIGWAFDELFGGQPNMGSVKQMPPGSTLTDISLLTFLRREWPDTALDLIACPSRLSGGLFFNCVGFQSARVNYNAQAAQRISHVEMVLLESVVTPLRGWEHLNPLPGSSYPRTRPGPRRGGHSNRAGLLVPVTGPLRRGGRP